MKKKEITPLSEGFMKSFAAKTKRMAPALTEAKTEVAQLEEQVDRYSQKIRAARLGGVGNVAQLVREQIAVKNKLEEAKKMATRPADKPEGEEATPKVDEKPAEHGHGKDSSRDADQDDGDKKPQKIKEDDDKDADKVEKELDGEDEEDAAEASDEYIHKRRKAISKSMKEGLMKAIASQKPLEEGHDTWCVEIVKPFNKLKKGDKVEVKARNTAEAAQKAGKKFKDNTFLAAKAGSYTIKKKVNESVELDEGKKTISPKAQKIINDYMKAIEGKGVSAELVKVSVDAIIKTFNEQVELDEDMSPTMRRNFDALIKAAETIEKKTAPNSNFGKAFAKATGSNSNLRFIHRTAKGLAADLEDLEMEVSRSSMYEQVELEEGFKAGDITFNIYAFTTDKAQLLVKKASVDHCLATAQMIEKKWLKEGYKVKTSSEG